MKDTSLEDRCTKGLKYVVVGEVNSLERRKLQKANVKADHGPEERCQEHKSQLDLDLAEEGHGDRKSL